MCYASQSNLVAETNCFLKSARNSHASQVTVALRAASMGNREFLFVPLPTLCHVSSPKPKKPSALLDIPRWPEKGWMEFSSLLYALRGKRKGHSKAFIDPTPNPVCLTRKLFIQMEAKKASSFSAAETAKSIQKTTVALSIFWGKGTCRAHTVFCHAKDKMVYCTRPSMHVGLFS